MINMASFDQEFMFGEFDDLSPEEHERIFNILHGQRSESANKVEFPWKDEEEESAGAVGGAVCREKKWEEEPIQFGTVGEAYNISPNEGYNITFLSSESQIDQPEGLNNNAYPGSEAGYQMPQHGGQQYNTQAMYVDQIESNQYLQQSTDQQHQYGDNRHVSSDNYIDRSGSKLQASLKPYERRNKKKRPPDYYKQSQDTDGQKTNIHNKPETFDLSQPPPNYPTQMQFSAPPPGINPNNYRMNQPGYIPNMMPNMAMQQQMDVPHLQQVYHGANSQASVSGVYTDNMLPKNGGSDLNASHTDHTDLREVVIDKPSPVQHISANIPAIIETYQNQDHERTSKNNPIDYNNSVVQKGSVNLYQEFNSNSDVSPTTIALQSNNNKDFNSGIDNSSTVFGDADTPSQGQVQGQMVFDSENDSSRFGANSDSNNIAMEESVKNMDTQNVPVPDNNAETIGNTQVSSNEQSNQDSVKPGPEVPNNQDQHQQQQQQPNSAPSVQVKKPVSSWAGLFKSNAANSSSEVKTQEVATASLSGDNNVTSAPSVNNDVRSDKESSPVPVLASEDKAAKELGEFLAKMSISHASVALQPRGLVNRANWCYINGTLQALVACPPFYYLLKRMPRYPGRGPSSTPILDAMVEFVHEFQPMPRNHDKGHKGTREISPGIPFEPTYVYKMLQAIAVNPHFKLGKQEDAEEFLSCILDGMHEEMSAAVNLNTDHTENQVTDSIETEEGCINGYIHGEGEELDDKSEEDSWEQVGPKKKSVLTRRANFAKTPIADIFAGMIRSAVYKTSAKETATLEPFFTLQLDIQSEKVCNVKEALEGFVSKEQILGYTCSNTKAEVEVSKKLSLEELPPVLILHLKFFVYDKDGGCQKVIKKFDYGVELEITKDLLSQTARNKLSLQQRSYKLFAVVYHHGKKATGGHYTTSVFHPGINGWIHSDDSQVKTVNVSYVLKNMPHRVPYLLYYRRVDSH
ncbi:Ubiquitin carboxyl-terminal hydrolase 10 [Mactra antiquata]